MAMEDVFLLYCLLQQDDDLPTIFQKFESIGRPRIEEIFKLSKRGGDMRRETGPWAQWFKETMMWLWLKLISESWTSGLFEYDITTVAIPSTA